MAGVSNPMPPCRCAVLYQVKNGWQKARAASRQPNQSGKSGRYFSVLNCASENGLSLETWGRLCVFVIPRSASRNATGFEVMAEPRSAWIVSCSRAMRCRVQTDEPLGQRGALAMGHHPADHVPAEDVEHDVEIEVGPLRRPQQLRNVPAPQLVASGRLRRKSGPALDAIGRGRSA